MNEFFDKDAVFVTAIGLYQIWSGQLQKTYKPRHYLWCGQVRSLGWEVPACIGPSSAGQRTSSKRGVWKAAYIANRAYQEHDAGGAGVVVRRLEAVRQIGRPIQGGTRGGSTILPEISSPVT